jgi:predicted glycosyltransferase/glycosyltransferase involved in cell wall biosynthesis
MANSSETIGGSSFSAARVMRKPMRICMLSYSFYESDTRIMQYASALVERGDTVDVVALGRPGQDKETVLDGVNVFHIQTRTVNERSLLTYLSRILRFLFVSTVFIARRHFSNPYHMIHVHSVPDFLVFAAIVPKLKGATIILDIHDILPEFYQGKFGAKHDSALFRLLLLAERKSVAFADHVIVANHLWCERIASRSATPEKCSVICNYPDPKLFQHSPRTKTNGKFLITFPGTLNWHQGVDVAIRAFARIKERIPGAEFHIYGEGPEKASLAALTRELGLENRVLFHDFLPTDQIVEVMASTDLAVVPKRASSLFGNEAASTKIMEFMSVGVPLIVSRTQVDSFYHDESRVKFFESENVEELAEAIVLLEQNPAVREQLVSKALQYVETNNWELEKQQYLSLVDSLVLDRSGVDESPQSSPSKQESTSGARPSGKDGQVGKSGRKQVASGTRKKVWIDLDNSPHVPFFVPIIEDLEKRGYSILLTARHAAQVDELLDFYHLNSRRVGSSYGKRTLAKVAGTVVRACRLLPVVLKEKPLFALSHGSRAQLVVASLLRLPCIVMTDYEFANQSMVRMSSSWALVPDVIPTDSMHMAQERVLHYPGIKEDVYVPRFLPDPALREQLGLRDSDLVVTVRPPASEAHYHNTEGDTLFHAVIDFLKVHAETKIVLLPRTEKQAALARETWPDLLSSGKMTIPPHVVDGLNLIWHSDLVISGGGTMNREAAALNVPVYSIFRGKIGAVDRYLVDQRRLILVENAQDLAKIAVMRRNRPSHPLQNPAPALERIVTQIDMIAQSLSPSLAPLA